MTLPGVSHSFPQPLSESNLAQTLKHMVPMKPRDFRALHSVSTVRNEELGWAYQVERRNLTPELAEAYINNHPLTAILKAKGECTPFITGQLLVVMVDPGAGQ